MITCVAMILGVSLGELPALALNVEAEARTLSAQTDISPALLSQIEHFSGDAERLSAALQEAGVEQDLPCIFHGIAADARERAVELSAADTPAERTIAFTNLRILLDDAILIAPMAASAAADRAAEEDVALLRAVRE